MGLCAAVALVLWLFGHGIMSNKYKPDEDQHKNRNAIVFEELLGKERRHRDV
jgi:hypothetical protein